MSEISVAAAPSRQVVLEIFYVNGDRQPKE